MVIQAFKVYQITIEDPVFCKFQEKENEGRDKVMSEISSFETSILKPTEVEEKNSLPTGDDITKVCSL